MEKVVTIEGLAFGGEGVGRTEEGKVIFVPQALPGDRVRVAVLSDHGRYERGEILEVVEKSPDRVEPLCSVFGRCGGCQWQHLKYEAQNTWKEKILKDTLLRVGKIQDPVVLPMIPAPDPWRYRQRIQLKVDAEGTIGFHGFHSHQIVPFEDCKIADVRLNETLKQLRSNGLHSSSSDHSSFELSLDGIQEIKRDENLVFSQVHAAQNESLIKTLLLFSFGNAEPAFTRKKTVVELYAGSGNFTFPLADRAGRVIAVEENPKAVGEGERRVQEEGIANIEWVRGTAEWGLKKVYRQKIPVDLLVLDPPRRGAKEILDLVHVIQPRTIVYISCDPVTLSRDLQILTRRYYRLEKVQPIDMFPQTYHIESVAQLSLI